MKKVLVVSDPYLLRIKEIIKRLYAYCHTPGCRRRKQCPLGHETCKKHLGLDTAIAWDLALYFDEKLDTMDNDILKNWPAYFLLTSSIRSIVGRHGLKYLRLAILTESLHRVISDLVAYKNNAIKLKSYWARPGEKS